MTCGGLAVVTPAEAIVGATTLMDVAEVRFPAMEAVQRGLLTPGDLEFSLGIPQAARRSMRLLAEEARQGAESGGEANFWRLIEQSHLPTPVLQYEIDTYLGVKRIDAYWQDSRLGAEIDGRTVHTKALAFERDMRRQNAVHATGVVLIRFPVSQVMNDPASVLRDVEANMEARRWDLASRR
jgi:very-short-patch-repair endonuclease